MTREPARCVVVSGASGLIGRALVPAIEASGRDVIRLVRGRPPGPGEVAWQPESGVLDLGDRDVDAVVHLAGENIGASRWTEARRRVIRDSRVLGTRTIVRAILARASRPRVLVSSSAVGIYGDRGEAVIDEGSDLGTGFLADVCRAWEAETEPAREAGVRVASMRTGVVLTPEGGALERLLTPFKLGVGGKVGGGRQWLSWVTLSDVVAAFLRVLDDDALAGPINLTAPAPVTQGELASTLARVLRRPAIVPLPKLMVKAMFGSMGEALLLEGQRVVPRRLLDAGFSFRHPALEPALRDMLGKPAR